jgi:RNA polymerase sigma-70 factor (ECF subfamily)
MRNGIDLATLVRQAQAGHQGSLEVLSRRVRRPVLVYLYRMTLDYHLAQDLTQETVLTMIQSLPRLKVDSPRRLWAWVYRTALGKVQHHLQKQERRCRGRHVTVGHDVLERAADVSARDGLHQAERHELIEAMTKSIAALKLSHRHVLVLRCFEQLSFAQIAEVNGGGTELQMRLLFFRAKRALKGQLRNRGFGRQYFLSGLTLFALATTLRSPRAAAAPTVTAGAVKVGALAAAIGTATTEGGLAVLGLAAILTTTAFVRAPTTQIPTTASAVPVAAPSRIVNVHDPDGDGWERLITRDDEPDERVPLNLVAMADTPGAYTPLILPAGHWIELGFGGGLVDAPGPDIEYYCLKTGKLPAVFLTDGREQTCQLKNGTRQLKLNWAYQVTFDLAKCQCPFTPTALRLVGYGPPTLEGTTVLLNVQARAKRRAASPMASDR